MQAHSPLPVMTAMSSGARMRKRGFEHSLSRMRRRLTTPSGTLSSPLRFVRAPVAFGFSLFLDSDFPEHSTQPRARDSAKGPAIIIKQLVQRKIFAVPFKILARRQAIHDGIPRRANSRRCGLIKQFYLRRCNPAPSTRQSHTARAHPITRPPARHKPVQSCEQRVDKSNGATAIALEKRCISQPVARKASPAAISGRKNCIEPLTPTMG